MYRFDSRKLLSIFVLSVLLASGLGIAPNRAHAAGVGQQSLEKLTYRGNAVLAPVGTTSDFPPSSRPQELSREIQAHIPRSGPASSVTPNQVPNPQGNILANTNPGFSGFNGLSHRDQRLAGTGVYTNTQFSLEPPDQGLCAGNGKVLEVINTALVVYTPTGSKLTAVTPINQFFHLAPEVVRSTPPVFGDFTSDPKCYFDSSTARWFLTVLQLAVVPSTGAFSGRSHLEIAVSTTGDPTGAFDLFSLDVTDDGSNGTPSHLNCPCLGDQPLIGADANGFYISTNEFPTFVNGFNGAQIYAMSKTGIETGTLLTVVHIDASQALVPFGDLSFSIQPASTPPGGEFAKGTEFFLSSLDFSATLDNRIALWALTGTGSLNDISPSVTLSLAVLQSEVYGQPPPATQKDGPIPLGDLVDGELETLNSNDDRMNQVVFADGKLWSGVNTIVQSKNGDARVGIAFFIVEPSSPNGGLEGSIVKQGYVSVNRENVMFPSIGVNRDGEGIMTFTIVGPDFFPSAAYAPINADQGAGAIHIAGGGAGPEDGFSGYAAFGSTNGVARWGDYSAAVAVEDGSVWMGVEYIPSGPRTFFANWGTFVSNVIPQSG